MKESNFYKAIDELKKKEVKMTPEEKSAMLSNIFSRPIESPYTRATKHFAFLYTRPVGAFLMFLITFSLSFGGVVFASGASLPGDLLYPVKTKMVEPILDVVYSAPEERIVWAEEKVSRRIQEAEILEKKDKLDEEVEKILEKDIEHSSREFAKAVKEVVREEEDVEEKTKKEEELKQSFREKINKDQEEQEKIEKEIEKDIERLAKEQKENVEAKKSERVQKLKDRAIKTVDEDDRDEKRNDREDRGDRSKNNSKRDR